MIKEIRATQPSIAFEVEVVQISKDSKYIEYEHPALDYYNVKLRSASSKIDFHYTFEVECGDSVPKIGDTFTVTIN